MVKTYRSTIKQQPDTQDRNDNPVYHGGVSSQRTAQVANNSIR